MSIEMDCRRYRTPAECYVSKALLKVPKHARLWRNFYRTHIILDITNFTPIPKDSLQFGKSTFQAIRRTPFTVS